MSDEKVNPNTQTHTDAISIGTEELRTNHLKAILPPSLILVIGPPAHVGRQWVFQQPRLLLGRVAPADIQIEDGGLSKSHASFDVKDGEVVITDLGSTNKTMVNGKELAPLKPQPLKNNDQIRAGRLVFKYLARGIVLETEEKARMQSELEKARSMQSSLLPAVTRATYDFVQIGGRYLTASECGGDWWWHWRSGNSAYAIIADAEGHGAAAAMLTSAARSAVATLEDGSETDIEKVFLTLSRAIAKCSNGGMTMSAFLVQIDLAQKQLRYINASHPWPVWLMRDLSDDSSWKSLPMISDGTSPLLGLANQSHAVGTCPIPPRSRLVLLTDGLIEREDRNGRRQEHRQFYSSLMRVHRANLLDQDAFLDNLLAESEVMANSAPLKDDITVVSVDFSHTV